MFLYCTNVMQYSLVRIGVSGRKCRWMSIWYALGGHQSMILYLHLEELGDRQCDESQECSESSLDANLLK